jgi:hypothetical protein
MQKPENRRVAGRATGEVVENKEGFLQRANAGQDKGRGKLRVTPGIFCKSGI